LKIRFGPAGKPITYKGDMAGVPQYLNKLGLDALEYEAVRGVRIREEKASLLGREAEKYGVLLSMHAPYYINLASREKGKAEASRQRLYQAVRASHWMKAYAVVFHPGYYKGWPTPVEATKEVIRQLKILVEEIERDGYTYPWLAPETTGKDSQVGSVEDIVLICSEIPRCRPTIDWAHLYARSQGKNVLSIDQVITVIDVLERELGNEAINPLHTHFSRIEYGRGGERMHHTLEEREYGPEWDIVCRAYIELGINATVISESPILEKDALLMKKTCEEVKK